MKAKLLLFSAGAIVVGGGFWAYQSLTGSSIGMNRTRPAEFSPQDLELPMVIESKNELTGDLESKIIARKAEKVAGHPGRYRFVDFKALFFVGQEQQIVIESSGAEVDIVQSGTKTAPRFSAQGGELTGNVTVTFGPKDTFRDNVEARTQPLQAGQYRASVLDEKDAAGKAVESRLSVNWPARKMTSKNHVAVRGEQIAFDGTEFNLSYNAAEGRIDQLSIARGDKIVIKPDASGNYSFNAASRDKAAPAVLPDAAASAPATPAVASTRKKRSQARTNYKLLLGADVKAETGLTSLTCNAMTVYFSGAGMDVSEERPVGKGPVTRPSPGGRRGPETATRPETVVGNPFDFGDLGGGGNGNGPAKDLIITWTGPLLLRPAGPEDPKPAHAKDVIFEAAGTLQRPVVVTDGKSTMRSAGLIVRSINPVEPGSQKDLTIEASGTAQQPVTLTDGKYKVEAGRLTHRRTEGGFVLEPGELSMVSLASLSAENPLNGLVCAKINFHPQKAIDIAGPGRIEFAGGMLGRDEEAATRPASTKKEPTVATFSESLAVEFGALPNPSDAKKNTSYIRHLLLKGETLVVDSTSSMRAGKSLDIQLVHVPGDKSEKSGDFGRRQALSGMVATGGVEIKNARKDLTLAAKDNPDSLVADTLEVKTSPVPGKAPQMDTIIADGNVTAVMHQFEKDEKDRKERLLTQVIETPKLTVLVEPRDKTRKDPSARGSFNAREVLATSGVKVSMEGYGGIGDGRVIATCGELTARPGPNNTGTATLVGMKTAGGTTPAKLQMGENSIQGNTIELSQAAKSITIPESGEFYFVETSDKDNPSPVRITWKDRMSFDQRSNSGKFEGSVKTVLAGKPDQKSEMSCNVLTVALLTSDQRKAATTAAGTLPASPDAKDRPGLREIIAKGKVVAIGQTTDAAGKVVTSMQLKAETLTFEGLTRTLRIPEAGEMVIQDFRPTDKTKAKDGGMFGGDNMRGYSGIQWKGSLVYTGDTGTIEAKKDVVLAHIPLEPFKAPGVGKSAKTQPKESIARLVTESLQVKLESNKEKKTKTSASPLALGESGQMKVSQFVASGGAALTVDEQQLVGNKLTFDTTTNKAYAEGNVTVTSGELGFVTTEWAKWDLTKDANAFELGKVRIQGGQ